MIEMLTVEGDGYTIDIIARITLDDDPDRMGAPRPSVRALERTGKLTTAIEEAVEEAV